jgi:hypothetical protein
LASLFTKEWKTDYNSSGINGYEFSDATSAKTLFFPAAGWRYGDSGGSLDFQGSAGSYWSATPYGSDDAWSLGFDFFNLGFLGFGYPAVGLPCRANGRSVRCVQN